MGIYSRRPPGARVIFPGTAGFSAAATGIERSSPAGMPEMAANPDG
jgi:hypothetical protein